MKELAWIFLAWLMGTIAVCASLAAPESRQVYFLGFGVILTNVAFGSFLYRGAARILRWQRSVNRAIHRLEDET